MPMLNVQNFKGKDLKQMQQMRNMERI